MRAAVATTLLFALALSHAGCFLNEAVEPYYGRVVVPSGQQFRWSDGGLPQTFDPAFAAAPPDTDLVRAIFEGLTDYDPQTLMPVPAVATKWEASNGGRTWTFYLRDDARWSNGAVVTAEDFVRSWQRTVKLGELAPHTDLLANIEGAEKKPSVSPAQAAAQSSPPLHSTASTLAAARESEPAFGAEALSDRVLRVRLRRPDMNFPALVAHPVFRPVKLSVDAPAGKLSASGLLSNGAFSVAETDNERVLLARAENYWDKRQVTLQSVEFVGARDTESALASYRSGGVDAVTNAALEPLAIKLLAPYADFRRTTFGALTYYTFNTARAPFDDVRVREALAIAIDRDRISADETGGATEPAKRFLPQIPTEAPKTVVGKSDLLEKDDERARQLLAEAGFPNGKNFPIVRLLVNRNEQQRLVAQAIAVMWRNVLNIQTELVTKNWDDYEAAIRSGDFDVVRRGIVMQTTDELTNIHTLFGENYPGTAAANETERLNKPGTGLSERSKSIVTADRSATTLPAIDTEAQALNNLSAMPIYFASSYALVKPYVNGFDANILDAPSLKKVRIDGNWKPAASPTGSNAR
ncbi:MAG: oligopeptide transport system substrate-binding protein [Pyrinomonadaceae bacterium]|jgi:ABC-type oligopeptide transport system substrate-binding subunit|nr:oligopeptide transport system substrate-binding protein [Pyrinomonadaceae bacterium]